MTMNTFPLLQFRPPRNLNTETLWAENLLMLWSDKQAPILLMVCEFCPWKVFVIPRIHDYGTI